MYIKNLYSAWHTIVTQRINSFNKHLLKTYYGQSPLLESQDTDIDDTVLM